MDTTSQLGNSQVARVKVGSVGRYIGIKTTNRTELCHPAHPENQGIPIYSPPNDCVFLRSFYIYLACL